MTELRVLVCDDDDDLLELMLRRFEGMGLKLDRAVDGGEAQALVEQNNYDLIVAAGHMYGSESTGDRIRRANLDGSGDVEVITELGNVRGIVLYP